MDDVLKLCMNLLKEEEAQSKVGVGRFGYLPVMALANIVAMNAKSFFERVQSCVL